MIMKKETLVFITSLAIIFIIGYINLTMKPENDFSSEEYAQIQNDDYSSNVENDVAKILEEDSTNLTQDEAATETATSTDENDKNIVKVESEDVAENDTVEKNYEILGDITDITDLNTVEASSDGILNKLNDSFASFKLNKEKGNMDVLDHIEDNISNSVISEDTKSQFEALLLNKNSYIETEQDIELMLQTKGYNETVAIVDENMIKVVSNEDLEQADVTKILDVIVSETNYEPSQIKIVKFDNIDL